MRLRIRLFMLLFLLVGICSTIDAQSSGPPKAKVDEKERQEAAQDTSSTSKIIVENSDNARFVNQDGDFVRYLNGNVRLYQDSTVMFCDSARLFANQLIAYGQVVIIQNDSIQIFADSLIYDGDLRIAKLYHDVILQNNDQQLFTEFLTYNMNTKVGSYTDGALLKNKDSEIKSKIGQYYVDEKEVRFYENVSILNKDFQLWTDSLRYDYGNDIAYFLTKTRIDQDSAKIYCEDGFYNIGEELAEFRQNAQYIQEDKTAIGEVIRYDASIKEIFLAGDAEYTDKDRAAKGDTIIYNELTEDTEIRGNAEYKDAERSMVGQVLKFNAETEAFSSQGRATIVDSTTSITAQNIDFDQESGLGNAKGDVIVVDTASNTTMRSENMIFSQETNFSKAYNDDGSKAWLYTVLEEDSLFLRADTLLTTEYVDSTSETNLLQGYYNVRMFKSNLQAKCDSILFNTTDSMLVLFDDPVMWTDSSQFSADTIEIYLKNEEIDKILMKRNGFIINTSDTIYFNQIKGKNVEILFSEGAIDSMTVMGNAESIYFMKDDENAYVGMNKSICSKMGFKFFENELKDIYFDVDINSNFTPITLVDPMDRLEGFIWLDKERPKNKNEL